MARTTGHGRGESPQASPQARRPRPAKSQRGEEGEARYRAIFEAGAFPKLLYDPTSFAILAVNQAASALYGYGREEFLALTLKDLRPPEEVPRLLAAFAQPIPDRYHAGVWIHRKKDGALIEVDVHTHAIVLEGRHLRLAELHDVTMWRRAEAALARRTQQLEAVGAITAEIVQELDLGRVLHLVMQHACALTGAVAADIDLWDGDRQLLVPEASYGHAAPRSRAARRLGEGAMATVAQTRHGLILNDYRSSPIADPDTIAQTAITASLIEPLLYRDTLVGVIGVDHETAGRSFSTQDQDLLRLLAAQAAIAIENARLFQAEQRQRRELEAVRTVGEEITRELDLTTLIRLIHEHAINLAQGDSGSVWLWDEATQRLLPKSWLGLGEWMVDIRLRLGEGVVGTTAARRQGLIVNDFRDSPYLYRPLVERVAHVHVLAEPLLYRDRLVGVLSINRNDPVRRFTTEEQRLVRLFSTQAAIAIENARLHEAALRRETEMEALLAATHSVMSGLDLQEILDRIVAQAQRISGAPHVKVVLLDKPAGVLRVGAARGTAHRTGDAMPLDHGLSASVVRSGASLYVPECADDPRNRMAARDRDLGMHAYLGLPIKRGDEVLGVLTMNTTTPKLFSSTEMACLTSFADQAAIAIEKARLFAELNDSYARLQAAQTELVRSEKLRGLGQMAAGIAHDLNNVLAAILGQLELVRLRGTTPEVQESLDVLETAATDGANVVRRLQDFARQRSASPLAPVDLGQAVQEALKIASPRWQDEVQQRGKAITVRVALGDLPPILGHAPEVREVLTNLIFNAVDAMPEGGTLSFDGAAVEEGVLLRVSDTGAGMPEAVRQRIFEPFFTTKGVAGTGLGLSVVYGIMERHGGRVEVTSTPGEGTTFSLWFQRAHDAPGWEEPEPRPPQVASRRILLIDDEAAVLRTTGELLQAAGHTVQAAESGPEGLARLEETPPDLVLTDLGMPEMSGVEVARRVKASHPGLPVILLTGWGDTATLSAADRQAVDRVLGKPVRLAVLLQVVTELTGSPDGAARAEPSGGPTS